MKYPEYELTWHFETSGDEAALEMYATIKKIMKAMETPDGYKASVTLTKVMDE